MSASILATKVSAVGNHAVQDRTARAVYRDDVMVEEVKAISIC